MDNEFESNVATETTVDELYSETEESSIVPKLVGIGAAVIGIGVGVGIKERDKIKDWFKAKKEAKKMKEAQKHLDALNKLGWKPEQETEDKTEE